MWKAKLVRGKTYYLGNKLFEAGKSETISDSDKRHLELNAIDMISVEGVAEGRQKFEFVKVEEPKAEAAAEASPKGRSRSRKPVEEETKTSDDEVEEASFDVDN